MVRRSLSWSEINTSSWDFREYKAKMTDAWVLRFVFVKFAPNVNVEEIMGVRFGL